MLKRITAGIITLAILLVSNFISALATVDEPQSIGNISNDGDQGYIKVAQSENLELYADMESGYFYIDDLTGNNRWYSVPNDMADDKITKGITKMLINSQIRVHYLVSDGRTIIGNEKIEASSADSLFKGGVSVKKIENGIRVEYTFPSIKSTIPVEYVLVDGNFEASIITKDIEENSEFLITNIELLPMFGAGNWLENGTLFVPDGCGALIEFNNGAIYNTYEGKVYGEEFSVRKDSEKTRTESVRMPVFATLKENATLMGVITSGDAAASVIATVGNDRVGYNFVSSQLTYKAVAYDTMLSNNAATEQTIYRTSKKYSLPKFTVRYYTLSGERSNYVSVAEKYREYLVEEKGLKANADKYQFNVDIYGAVETKGNFLGFSYRKTEALTNYRSVEKIISALKEKGIDSVGVRLIGWSKDGTVNYSQFNDIKYSSKLGGKKEFITMAKNLKQDNTNLVLDTDIIGFRKPSRKAEAKTLFKKTSYMYTYMRSVYSIDLRYPAIRLLTPNRFEKNTNKLLKSCVANGITNISLSTLTNLTYSDFNPKNDFQRCYFPEATVEVLKSFTNNGINVSGEESNVYAVPYLNRIYSSPTQTSAYKLFDKEIPFYQIVLHGFVSMTVEPSQEYYNTNVNFLKAVETGSELLFNGIYEEADILAGTVESDIYSSTYSYWKDKAAVYYSKYKSLLEKVYDSVITAHEEIDENVVKTTYSNGCSVVVNYNPNSVKVDGIDIYPYSFAQLN